MHIRFLIVVDRLQRFSDNTLVFADLTNGTTKPDYVAANITQANTSFVVLYVPSFCVSFCTVSPSVCLNDIYLG